MAQVPKTDNEIDDPGGRRSLRIETIRNETIGGRAMDEDTRLKWLAGELNGYSTLMMAMATSLKASIGKPKLSEDAAAVATAWILVRLSTCIASADLTKLARMAAAVARMGVGDERPDLEKEGVRDQYRIASKDVAAWLERVADMYEEAVIEE